MCQLILQNSKVEQDDSRLSQRMFYCFLELWGTQTVPDVVLIYVLGPEGEADPKYSFPHCNNMDLRKHFFIIWFVIVYNANIRVIRLYFSHVYLE